MLIQNAANLEKLEKIRTLQYLSHMVLKLYEDLSRDLKDDKMRFRLEMSFSPGCQIN
jgi:hypothetical protein